MTDKDMTCGPKRLHIDLETYSAADIGAGVYRYAADPSFRVLLVAWAADDRPVEIYEPEGDDLPEEVERALTDPAVVKCAHNAAFERVCLTMVLRRRGILGPAQWLDPAQWHCTMAQAARCGLPLSLADVGAALGLERQKMTEGKYLISLFCQPHADKNGLAINGDGRVLPSDYPDKWATFRDYCVRDVDVERQIDRLTAWLDPGDTERRIYAEDQRINDRGVPVDTLLAERAVETEARVRAVLTREAIVLTGLANPASAVQLKGWLSEQLGEQVESLTKATGADLRARTDNARVRRALEIREQLAKTSVSKYQKMLGIAGKDGRARGTMLYYGTRTGRWSGRLLQPQNLPKNHLNLADLEWARRTLREGDADALSLAFGDVEDILSQLVRTAIAAPEGRTLAVCDFSAIECRVLAWLSGEDWVLDVFRTGGDIYCATASQMFGVPVEKHGRNAELRQKGKIAALALGYGGGAGALEAMGGSRLGLTPEEEADIVTRWRAANPRTVRLWKEVEKAAADCCTYGVERTAGRTVFRRENGCMVTVELPSGRKLCYRDMATGAEGRRGLSYMGLGTEGASTVRRWTRVATHGGKLVENITQAVARDILAGVLLRLGELGIPVVFHVHDEAIAEVTGGEEDLRRMQEVFAESPSWAPDLPLRGDGYITGFYRKD